MDLFDDFSLDASGPMPMTEQIKAHVVEQLRSGRVAAGQRLPSLRSVARRLDVSLTTVERAFRDLRVEGRIGGRAGRGSFVRADDAETAFLRMSRARSLNRVQRDRLTRAFRAANPNASLVLSDDTPDVVEVDLDMLPRLAPELENIEEHVCACYGRAERGREVFEPLRVSGRLHMLPTVCGHSAVLLNKDLFRRAGVPLPSQAWTWDEALDLARAVADPDKGIRGFAGGHPATALLTAVLQNNGSLYDPSGRHCRLAEPEAIAAGEYLRRLAVFGAPASHNLGDVERDFVEGRLAMRVSRNWSREMLAQCSFDVGARPLPAGKRDVSVLMATGFGLRRDSPARGLAFDMLKALADMETWPGVAERRPMVPFTLALQDTSEVADVFAASLQSARSVLHQVDPPFRRDILRDALKLLQPALREIQYGSTPVADIMMRLRDHINTMIEPFELAPVAVFHEHREAAAPL